MSMVHRKGRVFRFGDHVDGKGRAFSLNAAQFALANPAGTEVEVGVDPVGKGHYYKDSLFAGKLGTATNFAVNDPYLDSEFSLHPLLNEAIVEKKLVMSAIFGVPSKKLLRIDVVDPSRAVIPEAVFFARDGEEEEVAIAFEAEFATMPMAAKKAEQADGAGSPPMLALMAQHIHDICASAYPAMCSPTAAFAVHEGPRKHMALIHTMTKTHGAACSKGVSRFAAEGVSSMPEVTTSDLDQAAVFAQMQKTIDDLKAQAEVDKAERLRERSKRIDSDAAVFARDNAAILKPASQPLFSALYRTLADADPAEAGVVEFAYGPQGASKFKGTPLELLKAAVASLPAHGMGLEKIVEPPAGGKAPVPPVVEGVRTFAADESVVVDPSLPTPEGQQATAERKAYLKGQAEAQLSNGYSSRLGAIAPRK